MVYWWFSDYAKFIDFTPSTTLLSSITALLFSRPEQYINP
jgi:hypothetical protein